MVNMKGKRYDVSGLVEAQFQPGSRKTVLKNLLGVTNRKEMDLIELRSLEEATASLIAKLDKECRYTAADIKDIHKIWLGKIYPWAGNYRQVNLTKGNFTFASAAQIPNLMKEFEEGPLRNHTPCNFSSTERIIQALAEVHTELVLIHPFREGNGRAARLFSYLMAKQSGETIPDFNRIKGKLKQDYFAAVREGLRKNYKPMEEIFRRLSFPKGGSGSHT